MLASYATGLVVVVVVMLAWVGVMEAWRRVFPDASTDPDVLAGRTTCHGCTGDCVSTCVSTEQCGSSACELDRVSSEED
jgi:hypothetical protein